VYCKKVGCCTVSLRCCKKMECRAFFYGDMERRRCKESKKQEDGARRIRLSPADAPCQSSES
jgi:hypothetical protein